MFTTHCRCINCITPPHLLKKLLENSDGRVRDAALRTLMTTSRLRGERTVMGLMGSAAAASSHGRRTISDCANGTSLRVATIGRREDGRASTDDSVNRAFEGLGATRDFYKEIFDRDSLNGHGMRILGYVHYGAGYNNAFWDGREMIFGDGDGVLFTDFTKSLDVIAHELTHGVTEFTAGLEYHNQSGALNESISDVFGSLVKQWSAKQTADQADWLIGAEVFTPDFDGDALRSMKEPGKAYDNPDLGRDPQPDHMSKYKNLPDTDDGDNGGVHINSGIPNLLSHLHRHWRIRLGNAGTNMVCSASGIDANDEFSGIRRHHLSEGGPAVRIAGHGAASGVVGLEGSRHPHQRGPVIGRNDCARATAADGGDK